MRAPTEEFQVALPPRWFEPLRQWVRDRNPNCQLVGPVPGLAEDDLPTYFLGLTSEGLVEGVRLERERRERERRRSA